MMTLGIYSIYDVKAETFMTPYSAPTAAHASRSFGDLVGDPETVIGKHPSDFTLFELGSMDLDSGVITVKKVSLGNGIEYVGRPMEAVS